MLRRLRKSIKNSIKSGHRSTSDEPLGESSISSSSTVTNEILTVVSVEQFEIYKIETLPEDLIVNILKFLPKREINRYRRLSRRFADVIKRHRLINHDQIRILQITMIYHDAGTIMARFEGYEYCYVGLESVSRRIYGDANLIVGNHPIMDCFYDPTVENAGAEFLRKILAISTIVQIDCYPFVHSTLMKRFFEIVNETRCLIECFATFHVEDVRKMIGVLQTTKFHCRQNVHMVLRKGSPHIFSKSDWDDFERAASMCNFCFAPWSLKRLLLIFQHLVEHWLTEDLHQPIFIICKDEEKEEKRFNSSGAFLRNLFLRRDISFEGITNGSFGVLECNAHIDANNFPKRFRIVRKSDKCSMNFTRQGANFAIVFENMK